jgi:hypothetical protein
MFAASHLFWKGWENMRKASLAAIASASLILIGPHAGAATISYEGDALPQASTPAWGVFLDDTAGAGGVVSGGILTITTAPTQSLGYRLFSSPGGWDPTLGGTDIDIRMKVVSQAQGAGRAGDFLVATGTQAWLVRWGAARVSEELLGGGFDLDTTDAFHTYRLSVAGTEGPLNIYVDGAAVPSVSLPGVDSTANRLDFGDQLDGDGGVVQWDYIRWTNNEVPEPASLSVLVLGGCALRRTRRRDV